MQAANQELLARVTTANENATARMDRMEQDWSTLKNLTTRIQADKYAPTLAAELDMIFNRCLQPQELATIAGQAQLVGAERRSFTQADLVIMASPSDTDTEQSCYICAEVSYTGATRDTARALRNSTIITRVTGAPCEAALISVRNDYSVHQEIRDGLIHWYELEERDLDNPHLGGN